MARKAKSGSFSMPMCVSNDSNDSGCISNGSFRQKGENRQNQPVSNDSKELLKRPDAPALDKKSRKTKEKTA